MSASLDALFPILPRTRHRDRLANGLRALVIEVPGAEVVSSCLWYPFGAAREAPGEFGGAHFLEHMMFKGSQSYGPGEVDRRTQALGGVNNAFTSHDATAYYFKFSPPHWKEGLAIEADRMRCLTLDSREVDSERKVILEELSMYEADPWDALDQAVQTALHAGHPYERPILGTRDSLQGLDARVLRSLHDRYYRPGNAVLVLAGGVNDDALPIIEDLFSDLEGATQGSGLGREAMASTLESPGQGNNGSSTTDCIRIERSRGSVARLIFAFLGPSAGRPDHVALRLVCGVLTAGRSSRLHQLLVEELELCQWVSASLTETRGPSSLSIAAELHPGVDPERVEDLIRSELERLSEEDLPDNELDRVRRFQLSGWVFGHDQVHDLAISVGQGLALFDQEDFVEEELRSGLSVGTVDVQEALRRVLEARSVVGWSLPSATKSDLVSV